MTGRCRTDGRPGAGQDPAIFVENLSGKVENSFRFRIWNPGYGDLVVSSLPFQ